MNAPVARGHCCHFIPPRIHTRIAEQGSDDQRRRALRSLSIDTSLRMARVGTAAHAQPEPALSAATTAVKQVTIYDAETHSTLPGRRVRGESDPPTNDQSADEAFDYISDTWQFYLDSYDRNSIDGNGLALDGTVHYEKNYDNAFWDGRRMVFGDGDATTPGGVFERFTKCIDIAGHELTHGVTEKEAGLIYWAQTGALNESISDVFGSMVKQYVAGEKADQADWLIGEGLFKSGLSNAKALRSMKAPGTAYDNPLIGTDDQPAHMKDYVKGLEDNGGVHTNSGIPNHAFYLAAINLGGYAWENAGLIWYSTLLSPWLRRTTQFKSFAAITVHQAGVLFPGGDAADAVRDAWAGVGLEV